MTDSDIMDQWIVDLHEKLAPLKNGGPGTYKFDLREKSTLGVMGIHLRRKFGKYEILIMASLEAVAVGLHMDDNTLQSHNIIPVCDPDLDDKVINTVQNYVDFIEFRGDNDYVQD